MTPNERVEHIRRFMIELYEFDALHPGYIDENFLFYFDNLKRVMRVTPFHKRQEDDSRILILLSKYWETLLKKMYDDDLKIVNYISYHQLFIEQINGLDTYYDTYYNILWNDVIRTPILVPSFMISHENQKHFYLPKSLKSI